MSVAREVDGVWQALLDLATARRNGAETAPGLAALDGMPGDRDLVAIFGPVLEQAAAKGLVLAHLGQSLDGMIATQNGASHYITGPGDLRHKHRLRALFDASVVGAGTVFHDDPQLTVRLVSGDHPLRVVLDADRRLRADYKLFGADGPPTLLICAQDMVGAGGPHGGAEVVGVPRLAGDKGGLDLAAVVTLLKNRGCGAILLEGGGVTVSRFLRAGVVDRLHLTIAPLILGSGRPGLALPGVDHPDQGRRPVTRHFCLGEDMLFDCALHDR
ncbi:MAG: RibD family protein [Alphaproteobacteria bacterium]